MMPGQPNPADFAHCLRIIDRLDNHAFVRLEAEQALVAARRRWVEHLENTLLTLPGIYGEPLYIAASDIVVVAEWSEAIARSRGAADKMWDSWTAPAPEWERGAQ